MNKSFLAQRDIDNSTALHYAFYGLQRLGGRYQGDEDSRSIRIRMVVKSLLEKGIDPTLKNTQEETALILAEKWGDPSIIEMLRKAEIDFNSKKK